jgi:hypothetical protein
MSALKRNFVFNSPRTWRGEYSTPVVVNVLDTLSNDFPMTSPAVTAFHSVRLTTEKKHTVGLSEGIYLRSSDKSKKRRADNSDPTSGELRDSVADADATAVDLFSRSIVTQHLIGRSTWDRVVGMHSEFARSLIASRLKDTRLVFVVNTAGSRETTAPSTLLTLASPQSPSQTSPRAPEFRYFIGDDSFPTLPSFEIASTPATVPKATVLESQLPSDPSPSLDNLSSQFMKTHLPTTPKPSFSPRKRSGVKCNPAVLVPLT